jgi:hypothetical protein
VQQHHQEDNFLRETCAMLCLRTRGRGWLRSTTNFPEFGRPILASYRVAIARFAQAETWATRPQPPRHSNSNIERKLVEDRSGPRSDDRLSPLGFPNLRAKESNFAQHVGNWRASLAFVPFTVVC